MCCNILIHQHLSALLVLTNYAAISTLLLVIFEIFTLHRHGAAVFKKTFSLVGTRYYLKLAGGVTVLLDKATLDFDTAFISAGYFSFGARQHYVLI